MSIFLISVFIVYFLSLGCLQIGFKQVLKFSSDQKISKPPKTRFSVLVPFRNEEDNLPELLHSFLNLNYPNSLFQIILINDDSTDFSEKIITDFIAKNNINIQLIQTIRHSKSPKKDALLTGVKKSNFEWIVTTDADCVLPPDWLLSFDSRIQNKEVVFCCGPILYSSNKSILENFQQFDGLSLQTVTFGSFGLGNPILANGANLAFKKSAFFAVNGFKGNNHLASGDDIFLLEKMKTHFPGKIGFLKSVKALVITKPQKTKTALLEQRIRWASKTSQQKNLLSLNLGILVFISQLIVVFLPVFIFFQPKLFILGVALLFLKFIFDFQFIYQSARVFNVKINVFSFLIPFLMYPSLIISLVLKSFQGNFSWKDRDYLDQK